MFATKCSNAAALTGFRTYYKPKTLTLNFTLFYLPFLPITPNYNLVFLVLRIKRFYNYLVKDQASPHFGSATGKLDSLLDFNLIPRVRFPGHTIISNWSKARSTG